MASTEVRARFNRLVMTSLVIRTRLNHLVMASPENRTRLKCLVMASPETPIRINRLVTCYPKENPGYYTDALTLEPNKFNQSLIFWFALLNYMVRFISFHKIQIEKFHSRPEIHSFSVVDSNKKQIISSNRYPC